MILDIIGQIRHDSAGNTDKQETFYDWTGKGAEKAPRAGGFRRKEPYVAIVTALGTKAAGMTREELLTATGLADGGRFGRYLEELEECGFVRRFREIGKKRKDSVYQLVDNFTLFHLRFVSGALSELEWERLERRRGALRAAEPAKAVHVVMVTNRPMAENAWSKEVAAFVTGDDLFR